MLKERMTPEEIAHLTGYSRQTINKWVRKEGWQTSPRHGVEGGKARTVHVNEQVRSLSAAPSGWRRRPASILPMIAIWNRCC